MDREVVTASEGRNRRRRWRVVAWSGVFSVLLAVMLGLLCGVGAFTFGYGQGASYLSNNPDGCINCHVMRDHYNSWRTSSHRHVAVCNDCHLPHHPIGKRSPGEQDFRPRLHHSRSGPVRDASRRAGRRPERERPSWTVRAARTS